MNLSAKNMTRALLTVLTVTLTTLLLGHPPDVASSRASSRPSWDGAPASASARPLAAARYRHERQDLRRNREALP